MPSCVFRYCKNTSKNVGKYSGITFHRFVPQGHLEREKWITVVQKNRSENTWMPSEHSCICSAHFKAHDFYTTTTGRHFLKKTAIPCDNLSEPTGENQDFPTSLNDVEVSDTESILDTPREIRLKNDLRKTSLTKQTLIKRNKKLQRQNKGLQLKIEKLTAIIKELKENFGINKKQGQLKKHNPQFKNDTPKNDIQNPEIKKGIPENNRQNPEIKNDIP